MPSFKDPGPYRLDLTVRKEVLWESETATDAEVRVKEIEFIVATGANNPAVGYNMTPLQDRLAMARLRRKQVYKITYPNGKIYVGMDLTGTALYMGSPSTYARIVADLDLEPDRFELTLRKEILRESDTATDAEVRAIEMNLIRETGANDPAICYDKLPRYRPDGRVDST